MFEAARGLAFWWLDVQVQNLVAAEATRHSTTNHAKSLTVTVAEGMIDEQSVATIALFRGEQCCGLSERV